MKQRSDWEQLASVIGEAAAVDMAQEFVGNQRQLVAEYRGPAVAPGSIGTALVVVAAMVLSGVVVLLEVCLP